MGNLEKALEKARRQRKIHKRGVSARQGPQNQAKRAQPSPSVSEGLPVIESYLERSRVLAHKQRSPEADVFRILRTMVLQIMNKSDHKTLAITSPRYGDGKTTIALNLALSIAMDLKQTVLLVDLDLRKPFLKQILGLKCSVGLTDYLLHDTPIHECFVRLPFERLSVLPGGKALDNSSEVLGSPKMALLAEELKTRYHDRFVIYDMPPVLEQDDSIAFLPYVDATLVVVRDGVTKKDDLETSLDRLHNANIIGTVLNNSIQR
jgi:capsular exopolysaccharide synthesis family protein